MVITSACTVVREPLMNILKKVLIKAVAGVFVLSVGAVQADVKVPLNIKQPKEGQYVHVPPTMEDLETADLHPELKRVIRRGYDLFMNTQQLRGKNVFNGMNCSSCHMGEGRLPFAGPVWPAAVVLPNYRPKNDHVNNLEVRRAGCIGCPMSGKTPANSSDDILALATYHQWLATGVATYRPGSNMYARRYPRMADPAHEMEYNRGKKAY